MSGPFFPPISPFVMPVGPFNRVIDAYGINLTWMRSHACPCTFDETQDNLIYGSADPACNTCGGHGVYWDEPFGPFKGLITFSSFTPSPNEPGDSIDEKWGQVQTKGEPTLTVAQDAGRVWDQATVYDAYVEVDQTSFFNANLQVGKIEAVPYQQGLSIAATGAVAVYNSTTRTVEQVTDYTVSGARVTLPATYPPGTGYVVQFQANQVWVSIGRSGSLPHQRPFGGLQFPRRFILQPLDLWTRARTSGDSTTPQGIGT